MAGDSAYKHIQFMSICCDKLDGARDIIDQDLEPRWKNVAHYFVDKNEKEVAKQVLGFSSVPFYVVANSSGVILLKGTQQEVDFNSDRVRKILLGAQAMRRENRDKFETEFNAGIVWGSFSRPAKQNQVEQQAKAQTQTQTQPTRMKRIFALDEDF